MGTVFQVLGAVGAVRGGAELVLRGRRERALLALLLAARGEVVSQDRLVDDLVLMRVQSALDMEEARLRPPGALS